MSYNFYLLGEDTLELITLGDEKSVAFGWNINEFSGPVLDLRTLRSTDYRKLVYLPKDLLKKLYTRPTPKGPALSSMTNMWRRTPLLV